MDYAPSERHVLEVVTSLNTRLLVVPLSSGTVRDVCGTIKSYHIDLFPEWGVVDVRFLEIFEQDAGKYRLPDDLRIHDLFWKAPRCVVFAELTLVVAGAFELPRLNIAGAANIVAIDELHQDPAESPPSPRRLTVGQSVPNLGDSNNLKLTPDLPFRSDNWHRRHGNSSDSMSNLDLGVVNDTHGHPSGTEVIERQLRIMKRPINEHGSPSDVGPATRPARCGRPERGEQLQLRPVSPVEPVKSSGDSGETFGQNEDEVLELPGDYKSSRDGSRKGHEREESSIPLNPREDSVGKDYVRISSDGDSSQPASVTISDDIESSGNDMELSSTDSEPLVKTEGRKVDFTTPKDGSGADRDIGVSKKSQYQRVLESRKGSEELLNPSQQKPTVISGSQQGLRPPVEVRNSLALSSPADESRPKDSLRAKKVRHKCSISDMQLITTSEAGEDHTKPMRENVRRSVGQKEKGTAAFVQDAGKVERVLQGRSGPSVSVELGEGSPLPFVAKELVPSGEGITEEGQEPGSVPEADDQRQAGPNIGADSNVQTPAPAKKRKRRKKMIPIAVEAASLDKFVAVPEGLEKVLPAAETTQGMNKLESRADEIRATGKEASDPDAGRKKQRKRPKIKPNTKVTQQDIRGYMRSELSQGNNLNGAAGDKETLSQGKSSRKTPMKRKLSEGYVVENKNIVLGLQQNVVPESLNKNSREGAQEKKAVQLGSEMVCTLCDHPPFERKSDLNRHVRRVHLLKKEDVPSELLQQVEMQPEASAPGGKQLLEDRELAHHTGPVNQSGSQESAEVPSKGEPLRSKRRRKLSVEFAEDTGRLKKSQKKSREGIDLVTDKVQVQATEQEERESDEDPLALGKKLINADEEIEAGEYRAVMNEKERKRLRNSSKKAEDITGMGGKQAIPFGAVSVEPAEADLPRELSENLQGQYSTVQKKKKKSNNLDLSVEGRKIGGEQVELVNDVDLTLVKKKRKKSNNLDPFLEGRKSGGKEVGLVDDPVRSVTAEVKLVVDVAGDQNATPEVANFQAGCAKEDKKSQIEKLQQLGFLREEGLRKTKVPNAKGGHGKSSKSQLITFSGFNLPPKSKENKSAEGSTADNSRKRNVKATTTPVKPVKVDAGSTADNSRKRNVKATTTPVKPVCPHGCGRDYSKKTSAYFRHIKACPLGLARTS